MNLESDVKEYYELDQQIKELTKKRDSYKEQLKSIVLKEGIEELSKGHKNMIVGDYIITVENRVTTKINQNLAKKLLTEKNMLNDFMIVDEKKFKQEVPYLYKKTVEKEEGVKAFKIRKVKEEELDDLQ